MSRASLVRTLFAATVLAAVLFAVALLALRIVPQYDAGVTSVGGTATNKVGFYGLEYDRAGDPYRWTSGYAFVQMPYAFRAAPAYLADVRLRAENPAGPQPLTFLLNEQPLATVTPTTQFRVYHMALPPPVLPTPELRLGLSSEPFRPQANPRPLGVIVSAVVLRALPYTDWPLLLTLALGPATLLLVLCAVGRPGFSATKTTEGLEGGDTPSVFPVAKLPSAILVAGTLGVALLLLVWRAHPAPLRLEWLCWLALLGAAGAALLTHAWPARLGLGLLCALAAFSGALWPSWLTDDAFISFRYAQNLVAGNGLVYNVGERVEGYTNFLWTMLAALALALGADIVVATYVAGVVLALALILVTFAIGRPLFGTGWALVAALFVATSQSLLVYTARGGGLETGLFALLALLGSGAYLWTLRRGEEEKRRRGAILASVLFALAALTRPEGALLLALTVVHSIVVGTHSSKLRTQTFLLLPFLAVVVPLFAWRLAYYGDPLPNTFYAKTGGGPAAWARGIAYVGSFASDFGGPLLVCAPLSLLIHGGHGEHGEEPSYPLRVLRALRGSFMNWSGYLALFCGTYAAYVVSVGGDHFPGHRFLVPLVPWLALLMAGGMAWVFAKSARRAALRRVAPAALAALLLVYSGYALTRSARYDTVLAGNDESVWLWAEIGWWLRDNAAPSESIAALGAGAIAFYSERPVIDLLGLTERHIARVAPSEGAAPGHEKRDPAYVLDVRRPTYIPRIWDDYFGGAPALRGRYELISVQTRYGRAIELWRLRR